MKHTIYDVIILGQGIAGSLLAYYLMKQGNSVCVISDARKPRASIIAAGLVQRISGRYFSYSTLSKQFFDSSIKLYKTLEKDLSISCLHTLDMTRYLAESHYKKWKKKRNTPPYNNYLGSSTFSTSIQSKVLSPCISLSDCYQVEPSVLLSTLERYFIEHNRFIESSFSDNDITVYDHSVSIKTTTCSTIYGKKAIFCLGSGIESFRFFKTLPFNSVSGDVLHLHTDHLDISKSFQKQKWAIPLSSRTLTVGATYTTPSSVLPTREAYHELTQAITDFGLTNSTITCISRGTRNYVSDNFPICGFHPHSPSIGVFSGFGSNGFKVAPSLAALWAASYPALPRSIQSYSVQRFY